MSKTTTLYQRCMRLFVNTIEEHPEIKYTSKTIVALEDAARKALEEDGGKRDRARTKPKGRVLPLSYLLGAIALVVALHLLVPVRQLIPFPWRLMGFLPLALGITLNRVADQTFIAYDTTTNPFERPHALVTDGVFRRSRHPMYLGMTLTVLGIAVLMGSGSPLPVVIALPIALDRSFVVPEEAMLETIFGDAYREYRKRVRRWI